MGSLDGKVAFITGAARGQGRSHAIKLAEEGADIIALDLGRDAIETVDYPLGTSDELDETVAEVEARGRRAIKVSAAVVWLCSDGARNLTGVSLPVDAGNIVKKI